MRIRILIYFKWKPLFCSKENIVGLSIRYFCIFFHISSSTILPFFNIFKKKAYSLFKIYLYFHFYFFSFVPQIFVIWVCLCLFFYFFIVTPYVLAAIDVLFKSIDINWCPFRSIFIISYSVFLFVSIPILFIAITIWHNSFYFILLLSAYIILSFPPSWKITIIVILKNNLHRINCLQILHKRN